MKIVSIILACCMFVIGCGAVKVVTSGKVEGTIGVILGDGSIRSGARIEVALVTKSIPIPYNSDWDAIGSYDKRKALLQSGLDFDNNVKHEMEVNPNYIIARTTSNLNGQFEFADIKEGNYFILIDSVIGQNGVIWQLPVSVKKGKTIKVELSNDNLAMPSAH